MVNEVLEERNVEQIEKKKNRKIQQKRNGDGVKSKECKDKMKEEIVEKERDQKEQQSS